ncbi:transcriptional regulatory protein YebC [Streptomyces microflavus]
MSGHSKWATTKHKKAVIDAKRGKLFAKLIKNIEVAARSGGVDPDGNPTLVDAIQKAKKSSVPNKNIDSAVKRGGGLEAGGADYETIMYEGYGPNGVAVLIECLTDNRNRAASDVRVAMTRNGGSMADPGSVSYLFNRKGVVIVPKGELGEDDVLGAVLDAGAEEVNDLGESFEVVSEATDMVAVRTALQAAGIDYDSAEANFLPTMQVELDEEGARKIFKLIDALEDSDDVQNPRCAHRFGVTGDMEFYAPVELERVIHRSARLLDVGIDVEGAAEIAGRSRGTPRIANRLLRRVRDYAQVKAEGTIDRHIAAAALKVYEVDERGLDRLDRAVLGALLKLFGGGPVGLSTLAVAVGEERETVEEVAEPFLVREGLLARTPRGRVATPAAWAHLGLVPPQHGAKGQQGLFGA